jgi:hypothetical protein
MHYGDFAELAKPVVGNFCCGPKTGAAKGKRQES